MQFLSYAMCSSMLSLKFFIYSKYHSAHSVHRDQRMRQVVTYRRLKAMENHYTFRPKNVVAVTYRRFSFTRGSSCKALSGKVLVFWIGGRLWEVVAYKRWSQMEVRLYLEIYHIWYYRLCFSKFSCVTLYPDPYRGWSHLQVHLQTHPLCGSLQVIPEKAIF